jgi:hypothetical protein
VPFYHYMIRSKKSPLNIPLLAGAGFMLTGGLIALVDPDSWWKEALVFSVFLLSCYLLGSMLLKHTKWNIVVVLGIAGLLLLNRVGVLDILTGALLMIILGLISLIN